MEEGQRKTKDGQHCFWPVVWPQSINTEELMEKRGFNQESQEEGRPGTRHKEGEIKAGEGEAQEGACETLQTLASAWERCPDRSRTPEGAWEGASGQMPKDTLNINQSPLHRTPEVVAGPNPDQAQVQHQRIVPVTTSKSPPAPGQSEPQKIDPV